MNKEIVEGSEQVTNEENTGQVPGYNKTREESRRVRQQQKLQEKRAAKKKSQIGSQLMPWDEIRQAMASVKIQ